MSDEKNVNFEIKKQIRAIKVVATDATNKARRKKQLNRNLDGPTWKEDSSVDASVWTCGGYPNKEVETRTRYLAARVNDLNIFRSYAPKAWSSLSSKFQQLIEKISTDVRKHGPNVK